MNEKDSAAAGRSQAAREAVAAGFVASIAGICAGDFGANDVREALAAARLLAPDEAALVEALAGLQYPKTRAAVVGAGVGDVLSQEKGSGARFNVGKPDFSLIPLCTLEDEARVWEYGRAKYAAWNWTKGMAWSIPFACAMRHMAAWQRGEECDQESGLPHLAHAMCNLRMLTLYGQTYQVGDDRPVKELQT
jgi:hypothetical protein